MAVSGDCWWEILHKGHHAWYQRALVAGDFAPGLVPRGEYVVDGDGRAGDPGAPPTCDTCHAVPAAADLLPVERISGLRHFLEPYRSGQRPWSKAGKTSDASCWYCNAPPTSLAPLQSGLCAACTNHLKGGI